MVDIPTATKPPRGFHMRQSLAITLAVLGGRAVRVSFIALALLLVGWLVYLNAITPLQEPVGAPEGVPDINPAITTPLLQEINARGVERSQFHSRSFTPYNRFFEAQPTSTSLPSAPPSPASPGPV